uniref:Link domain-containing protein n=1 Tax=Mola mola TaxID=94237 RepID=A0A3Q4B2R4_MOLML
MVLGQFPSCFCGCIVPLSLPQSDRVAGVFLLIDGGKYTLNFTAARAACRIINATIATRAQMERAVQHGLETCKYVESTWDY